MRKKIIYLTCLSLFLFGCASSTKQEKMSDERYIEYVLKYAELKNQQGIATVQQDYDTVKKVKKELEKLEKKYPGAPLYPLTLRPEQQLELNAKLQAAKAQTNDGDQ